MLRANFKFQTSKFRFLNFDFWCLIFARGAWNAERDCVLFVERSSELFTMCELKPFGGGVVKASLKRAISTSK